jgi:hypothetical protein
MGKTENVDLIQSKVTDLVVQAVKLPGVHVDREQYLRAQFDKHCTPEMLDKIVAYGPHTAGVPTKTINALANSTIKHEVAVATSLSAAAGIPGGWAMLATIPADLIQFHGGLIRTAQKLAYLHDWPELFTVKGDKIDDETKNVILLFVGVMFGVQGAIAAITKLATQVEIHVGKQLAAKALTKTAYYPIIKKVVIGIGGRMNKTIFANAAAKFVPLVGAALSGGLTFFTFRPMSQRLNKHLLKVAQTKKRSLKKAQLAAD